VLSGVSNQRTLDEFPFKPDLVFPDVGKIPLDQLISGNV